MVLPVAIIVMMQVICTYCVFGVGCSRGCDGNMEGCGSGYQGYMYTLEEMLV
jgi:hypothetical protein